MITCDERRDLMLLYVTGALEPAETAEVRGHLLGGCPACAGALAEAEATVHRIPESLKPVPVPKGAWGEIERRIAVKERLGDTHAELPFGPKRKWLQTAAWAAAIIVILTLGLQVVFLNSKLSELVAVNGIFENKITELSKQADRAKTLDVRLADLERQLKTIKDENRTMLVSLEQSQSNYVAKIERLMHADQYAISPAQDKAARGTLFWNKGDGTWTVMASNLKPLPAGRCYEMWIVTAAGEKLAAGTFDATPSGTAMYEMKLPADVGTIQLAAVTDEPIGGVAKATGQIQFLSDVTKKQ